jgi:adenylylsulfate kinase
MNHITWHPQSVARSDRNARYKHKSGVVWFTGLSGSGKSTIANALDASLFHDGIHTYVLDGDNVRHGLNNGLGFTAEDRHENIRRIAEVAKLFSDAGIIVITAFISPFREDRERAKHIIGENEWMEVYVQCPIQTCMDRDPKGLYAKAIKGEIAHFTGISSPYEPPEAPNVVVDTETESLEQSVRTIKDALRGWIA